MGTVQSYWFVRHGCHLHTRYGETGVSHFSLLSFQPTCTVGTWGHEGPVSVRTCQKSFLQSCNLPLTEVRSCPQPAPDCNRLGAQPGLSDCRDWSQSNLPQRHSRVLLQCGGHGFLKPTRQSRKARVEWGR